MRQPRFTIACALLLLLVGSARIICTYNVFNHTTDEPGHLAAGLEWIEGHRYVYDTMHPPLERISGALGAYLAGARLTGNPNLFEAGLEILGRDEHYDRVLFFGRLGILPFFWLAGAVVFLWSLRLAGPWAAVLSVYFFTTTPSILAHAGLLTTDMALAACVGAAFLASLYWKDRPNLWRSTLFGICLALAILSKFSAIVFLIGIWGAMFVLSKSARATRLKSLPVAGVLAILAFIIWAAYWFSFGPVRFLHMSVPAPEFFDGLHSIWARNKNGGPSYLLGRIRTHGFWYFFPVTLLVKTPIPMLILVGASISLLLRKQYRAKLAPPLIFVLGVLLPAMASRINIGTRHVLPIFLAWSVICGIAAYYFLKPDRPRYLRISVVALLAWQGATSFITHPNYLAYTNAFAGNQPEKILVDSDLDWGQDMKRLGERLNQLGVKEVNVQFSNRGYFAAGHPFPPFKDLQPGTVPPSGWSAISLTAWKFSGVPQWANDVPPRESIGRSMYLYYFPENTGR